MHHILLVAGAVMLDPHIPLGQACIAEYRFCTLGRDIVLTMILKACWVLRAKSSTRTRTSHPVLREFKRAVVVVPGGSRSHYDDEIPSEKRPSILPIVLGLEYAVGWGS